MGWLLCARCGAKELEGEIAGLKRQGVDAAVAACAILPADGVGVQLYLQTVWAAKGGVGRVQRDDQISAFSSQYFKNGDAGVDAVGDSSGVDIRTVNQHAVRRDRSVIHSELEPGILWENIALVDRDFQVAHVGGVVANIRSVTDHELGDNLLGCRNLQSAGRIRRHRHGEIGASDRHPITGRFVRSGGNRHLDLVTAGRRSRHIRDAEVMGRKGPAVSVGGDVGLDGEGNRVVALDPVDAQPAAAPAAEGDRGNVVLRHHVGPRAVFHIAVREAQVLERAPGLGISIIHDRDRVQRDVFLCVEVEYELYEFNLDPSHHERLTGRCVRRCACSDGVNGGRSASFVHLAIAIVIHVVVASLDGLVIRGAHKSVTRIARASRPVGAVEFASGGDDLAHATDNQRHELFAILSLIRIALVDSAVSIVVLAVANFDRWIIGEARVIDEMRSRTADDCLRGRGRRGGIGDIVHIHMDRFGGHALVPLLVHAYRAGLGQVGRAAAAE